ncbi:MAG TPA: hypothetical protein VMR62_31830 [Bryobacteraceae bacterium]|jgi:hypothetical protein|nr:hypothetical protein [Bryobacteraceae bacterium]
MKNLPINRPSCRLREVGTLLRRAREQAVSCLFPKSAICGMLLMWLAPGFLAAQTAAPDLAQIIERLDRLEQQNQSMAEEIRQLRQQLAEAHSQPQPPAAAPAPDEKTAVDESRLEELAQSKVEASQKFPIRVTGMALFNAFLNSKGSGGMEYPTFAWPGNQANGGGSFYQTTIGLDYSGPQIFGDGKVHGSVYMDFAGGSGTPLDFGFRLRTGEIAIDWPNQSILAGVEPPIFAPRSPTSLAQVEFAPLSAAGNLWLWTPQVRFEQKIRFTDSTGLRAQIGAVQTNEVAPYQQYVQMPEPARPGLEGRFEFYHRFQSDSPEGPRFEIAPGFHTSVTHVAGDSVPSNLFSLDWFTNPVPKLEFTGAFFSGQNTAPVGGLEGFTILPSGAAIPVHTKGGWGQLTLLATSRLSFHLFSGLENGRATDLAPYVIGRNWVYGANFFYRLAPNVLFGPEVSQARTTYIDSRPRMNNHYDLALAYLF